MSKKQVNKAERDADRFLNERAVFDKPVKAQRGAIHKVVAQGVTIEFTDRYLDAQKAYKDALLPKEWFKLGTAGTVDLVAKQVL